MYEIMEKQVLGNQIKRMVIAAPLAARAAKPGQFVILRVGAFGERIPLTIAGSDPEQGTVTLIFQEVGRTTMLLGALAVGDSVTDMAGPLGVPSHLSGKVCIVAGGLGCAIAYPQAKALLDQGTPADMIAGFRSADLVFMEEEMRAVSHRLDVCTDDGSAGRKGLVTDALKERLEAGERYDAIFTVGPLIMMKFVCLTTKPFGVKTMASLNSIMVDGTGMCGCCRVSVDGQIRFTCVDGPDFDGHAVDFDEAMRRGGFYREAEAHACRLMGGAVHG